MTFKASQFTSKPVITLANLLSQPSAERPGGRLQQIGPLPSKRRLRTKRCSGADPAIGSARHRHSPPGPAPPRQKARRNKDCREPSPPLQTAPSQVPLEVRSTSRITTQTGLLLPTPRGFSLVSQNRQVPQAPEQPRDGSPFVTSWSGITWPGAEKHLPVSLHWSPTSIKILRTN